MSKSATVHFLPSNTCQSFSHNNNNVFSCISLDILQTYASQRHGISFWLFQHVCMSNSLSYVVEKSLPCEMFCNVVLTRWPISNAATLLFPIGSTCQNLSDNYKNFFATFSFQPAHAIDSLTTTVVSFELPSCSHYKSMQSDAMAFPILILTCMY